MRVLELVAVEHAAGGLDEETPREDGAGDEAARAGHCGLCGLTSDRAAWERVGDELGVPVSLESSDDLAPEEVQVVREVGTPCVLARFDDHELHPVALAERLAVFEGDVTRLVREVRVVAEQQGWTLPVDEDPDEEPQTI